MQALDLLRQLINGSLLVGTVTLHPITHIEPITTALINILSFAPDSGTASQYDPGIMKKVIANRQRYEQLPAELPVVDGYIAVVNCERIGDVWLVKPSGGTWQTMLVVDCSGHPETTIWMLSNNILIEIDHETAQRWNTVGSGIRIEVLRPSATFH